MDREFDEPLFLNTCPACGETWLLPVDLGQEFACMMATGLSCAGPLSSSAEALPPEVAGCRPGEAAEARPARAELLCQVLEKHLGVLEAAELLTSYGLAPPSDGELAALSTELRCRRAERGAEQRAAIARAQGSIRKSQQRYVDGKLVEVARGSKYVVEPRESGEERAKTSCSIAILGGRGKPSRTAKKKGPVS